MKKTLFPLVLLSAAALAAENITGAFGLELGAVQDTSNLESTCAVKGKDSSCYKEYYIKPPSPNEIFTDYTVTLTPVLNKIMEIQGFNTFKGNCNNQTEALADALSKKYGVKKERVKPSTNLHFKISKGNNEIRVICINGKRESQMQIYYVSKSMHKLSDKEKETLYNEELEKNKNKTDTSTL